ncbi:LD-carboxypeptidase [Microbacterium sp. SSW1-49]|uniref:LD-carboxypeptidase n=1 Tax=Microbacterium croceum TaxID=2851645 RepID=A0ABT0FG27_9MICO|nr:LD-carboxypeptidase [Microbacterium croceum]MCK2037027.1 LD-carboxypeptidase [Microbacterium croceum]
MKRPPRLRAGDEVVVVSPSADSAGSHPRRLRKGIRQLRAMGLNVRMATHALDPGPFSSAPVAARVADLHAAFADETVRGVFCAIGGYGASELLPALDFDLIAANPKVFCGYSDITSLHVAMQQRSDLVTFYGPSVLNELGENGGAFIETLDALQRATMMSDPLGRLPSFDRIVTERADWIGDALRSGEKAPEVRVVREGRATGVLGGGCLPVLCQLLGTPWSPDLKEKVVVLETPQVPYSTARAHSDLWHLRNAGVLAEAAGIVVGWPAEVSDIPSLAAAVESVTGDLGIPVIVGFPVGHTSPMATLPMGVRAELDAEGLVLLDSGVRE